jgi:hypothetical protein
MKEVDVEKRGREEEKELPSSHHNDEEDHDHGHALDWRDINRVLFVAAAAGAIWFLGGAQNPYIAGIGVICTLVGGFPIFHEAYDNIVEKRMTMELSMTIAIVAALAIRELSTALVITLFVLVAEILEGLTVGRGRRAIQHLIDLLPSTATVRVNGEWKDVEIQKISTNDEVLVRPGGRIPVDGKVAGGHSFVDQAPIICRWRKPPAPSSMLARLIRQGRWKFGLSAWAETPHSARSSRQSNGLKNRVPRFRVSLTDLQVISYISLWLLPALPSFSATMRGQPSP